MSYLQAGMKTCYYRKLRSPPGLAVVDLVEEEGDYYVTRVNVPPPHRGKGVASQLMREVCCEADYRRVALKLSVIASGCSGLSNDQLLAWYRRLGFVSTTRHEREMMRRPR